MNVQDIRKDFPILVHKNTTYPLIYCDNAATMQKPTRVLNALMHFYTTTNANIYRGIYDLAENATQAYEEARQKVAHFIGADAQEVVFTRGTTEGINFIVSAWAEQHIGAGDEIVLTELEHHANFIPWQRFAYKKGAVIKYIPVTHEGTLNLSYLDTIITSKTRLVSMVHVSNAVGTHVNVYPIISAAKAVGARVLIDAAQSIAHQPVNVKDLGCDFFVFSGHKMMGPTGIGVLYIAKEMHASVEPYQVGGGMVETVTMMHSIWEQPPHKFEAGTPAIAQAIGLGAAIDYYTTNINFDVLQMHEAALCEQLIAGLSSYSSIRLLGPLSELKKMGHMVSFLVDGIHSHDVAAFLNARGIAVRAGHHCAQPFALILGYDASVRVSFAAYNTHAEVECIIAAINELLHIYKVS
jgi:cysteine desulfurase/selenocysteine lyase